MTLPVESTPEGTVLPEPTTGGEVSDTEVPQVPTDTTELPIGTVTDTVDSSFVDPAPTSTGTGEDDDWQASLPVITGSTTITTTGPNGEATTETLNEGSGGGATTSDGGDDNATSTGDEGSAQPTPTTVTSTSTEEGGSQPTGGDGNEGGDGNDGGDGNSGGDGNDSGDGNNGGDGEGSDNQPPEAGASRVQAVGAGLFAVLAGLLAL